MEERGGETGHPLLWKTWAFSARVYTFALKLLPIRVDKKLLRLHEGAAFSSTATRHQHSEPVSQRALMSSRKPSAERKASIQPPRKLQGSHRDHIRVKPGRRSSLLLRYSLQKAVLHLSQSNVLILSFCFSLFNSFTFAQPLTLLDVGALSGTSYSKFTSSIVPTYIDLNPVGPNVEKADFFTYAPPKTAEEKFDVVGLSLVVNFVGDLTQRGE